MLILLQDAQSVPGVFYPFGAIPTAELREWLRQNALVLPSDLIELWEATAGGDIFDREKSFPPPSLQFQTPVSLRMTSRAEMPLMPQKENHLGSTYSSKESFSLLSGYP